MHKNFSASSGMPVKGFKNFNEALIKLIRFMVRQAHNERNQLLTIRPELVEGLIQRLPNLGKIVAGLFGLVSIGLSPCLQAIEAGAAPPSCALKSFKGNAPIDLSAYKGKVVFLDFWASWCVSCVKAMGFLDEMQTQLNARGLEVIGVNEDENSQDAEDFLARHPVKFSQAADADGQCGAKFGVQAMPASFLIDRAGKVRYVLLGYKPGENAEIRKKIIQLLDE